jgi:plasmid maintenance system killer protein
VGRTILYVCIFFSTSVFAGEISCNITNALMNPRLQEDQKFWQELGDLGAAGKYDNHNIENLLKKYDVAVPSEGMSASAPKSLEGFEKKSTAYLSPQGSYSISNNAEKDIGKLQNGLRKKFDEFLTTVGGGKDSLKAIRANPGRWGLEKLAPGQLGEDTYSVRLNSAYRAVFRLDREGLIEITAVSKTLTHSN